MKQSGTTLLAYSMVVGLILCLSTPALANTADQIVFTNGDKLTGRVLGTNDETVSFSNDAVGTITIQRSIIQQVITGTTETATPTPPSRPSADCQSDGKPVLDSWSFSFNGTPNKVVLGTQSQEQFGAGVGLGFCEGSKRDTTVLTAIGNHSRTYKEKSTSIETDIAGAELDQLHFFKSPDGAALVGIGELFTNNSLGMAMQKSFGIGLVSPQYNYKKSLYYDFSFDARYVNEHLDHSSQSLDLAGLRFKQQAQFQPYCKANDTKDDSSKCDPSKRNILSWNEVAWVLPMVNDVHGLQAYASVGPSLALKKWLTLKLAEEERYLGNAPHPNRKNYFASTISLTISGSGPKPK